MLTLHHISKSFDTEPLLHDITFSVTDGEHVALVGPNGCGKTTLLRIIAGEERPDTGHVAMPNELRLGYLRQSFTPDASATLEEVIASAAGGLTLLEKRLQDLSQELARQPDSRALQTAYDRTLQRLSEFDPGRAPAILEALGLGDVPAEREVGRLSGGQKTRLSLALVLLGEPDFLLLDEPTNHLDIAMLEWLEEWLATFSGGALIVSHDRAFLDRTVGKVLALDPHRHTLREYTGNYSDYVDQRRQQREKQWAAYRDQQYEIRMMRQDIARIKQQAQRTEAATKNDQLRRYAKKVARKAKAREKKLDRYLASEDRVEKPPQSWRMKLEFAEPAHLGQDVLTLEGLSIGYPGRDPLLANLNQTIQSGQHVVLSGPNGSGKTTLLRTIAGRLPALSGHARLGATVRLGYMSQEQRFLDPQRTALEMVQRAAPLGETDARSFLHYFLFSGDEPLRAIADLSFGERARLALAVLVVRGCNFLLLDEPINHLDIPSRDRFEAALRQFEGTVLSVVHDRYFIDALATDIWLIRDRGIEHQLR